jgi:hypothetical protein
VKLEARKQTPKKGKLAAERQPEKRRKVPPLFKERQLCRRPEPVSAIERPGEPPPPTTRADTTQPTAKNRAPKLPHIWEIGQFMGFYGQFMGFYRLIWGNLWAFIAILR